MRFVVVLTAWVCAVGVPDAQAATSATIDTTGIPANLRYGPGTQYGITGSAANGQSVTIVCTTSSEPTSGKNGSSTVWNKLDNGSWVAGAFVRTSTPAPVEPECGSTGVQPTGDDYPYRDQLGIVDRWLMYSGQCTSWVAWRMEQLNGYFHNYAWRNGVGGHWGNAYGWDDNAVRLGYLVDRIPKPGAIAHWEAGFGGAGGLGHVAYIAAVQGSTVTVQEYNWAVDRGYGTRDVPLDKISNIIHYAQGT